MPTRPNCLLIVLLAAASVLAACGDDPGHAGSPARPSSDAIPAPDAAFPVTVDGDNGPVEIAAQPTRIVSLSASVTEILFAMEAGDQVVAVDQHSSFPAEAPVTDLSGFRPNIEALGGYEPDLVVASSDRDGLVSSLTSVGVPVLLLTSPTDLSGLYDHIEALGQATGRRAEAEALTTQIRTGLEDLATSVPERATPLRYLLELSDSYHSVSNETFIGDVLGLAGMTSIADGAGAAGGYPQLTAEHILDADPDVVLLAHTDGSAPDLAAVAARPGWADLAAVRHGRVVTLDADVASRWGPRVVELLRAVVDATAPEPRA